MTASERPFRRNGLFLLPFAAVPMIAAFSLARWRIRGRRRFWSLLAALSLGIHVLAMAVHQPPVVLAAAVEAHDDCHEGGHGGAPDGDHGPQHQRHPPPCSICQSLHVAVPSDASFLAGDPWVPVRTFAPRLAEAPPPRLVLTDLNPRGPPVLV